MSLVIDTDTDFDSLEQVVECMEQMHRYPGEPLPPSMQKKLAAVAKRYENNIAAFEIRHGTV